MGGVSGGVLTSPGVEATEADNSRLPEGRGEVSGGVTGRLVLGRDAYFPGFEAPRGGSGSQN